MSEIGVSSARQERSRKTERAIAEAMSTLLREKPFPEITVAAIASRAGVSIGGFYARYRSKEALLDMVEMAILEEFSSTATERLANPGTTIGAIAQAYASMLVSNFRSRRVEIVQILRYVQNHTESRERVRRFNAMVHARMHVLLHGMASERAVNMALFFSGAAAREAILTQNLSVYPITLTDEELATEIARAFTAYLETA